ncbi:uncharacterized protein DNG_02923 [Cephalotrichum gorgonifer]|uniref:Uncharacterized protein n=1 Tax=Cephalotrichum gorgonifer TaxID=2041049 RepID=A0AAE8ST35_9PEZI|nr:uncharacterized protein DNG_02923 [Cephalotrichum gorgonifer]
MVSFFGLKLGEKKKDDLEDTLWQNDLKTEDAIFFGSQNHPTAAIEGIELPPAPRSGSAMSNRSFAGSPRTLVSPPPPRALASPHLTKTATPSRHDLNPPNHASEPSSPALGEYHDTPSFHLPRTSSLDSFPRPTTSTGRTRALIPPSPRLVRDYSTPRSPLAQSHKFGTTLIGEPSPLSDSQPRSPTAVSSMSFRFPTETHPPSTQGTLPSPPGSFSESRKPSKEELNPKVITAWQPPAGNTVRLVNPPSNPEADPPPASTQAPLPEPLPSPADSGTGIDEKEILDVEPPWSPLPVVQNVQAYRDPQTVVAPRQTSITTHIVSTAPSPLAEFKFSEDDAEVLTMAHRTSSPTAFSAMNREQKPLPLKLAKPTPRNVEDRAVSSPLGSPPASRAAAGLGICGEWPLGGGIIPGVTPEPPPSPHPRLPLDPPPVRGRLGSLAESGDPIPAPNPTSESKGFVHEEQGPMQEHRDPPVQQDSRGPRGSPPNDMRPPEANHLTDPIQVHLICGTDRLLDRLPGPCRVHLICGPDPSMGRDILLIGIWVRDHVVGPPGTVALPWICPVEEALALAMVEADPWVMDLTCEDLDQAAPCLCGPRPMARSYATPLPAPRAHLDTKEQFPKAHLDFMGWHPADLSLKSNDLDHTFNFPAPSTPALPVSPDPAAPPPKWTSPRPAPTPGAPANKSSPLDNPNWPLAAPLPPPPPPVMNKSLPPPPPPPGMQIPAASHSHGWKEGGDEWSLEPPPRNPMRPASPMTRTASPVGLGVLDRDVAQPRAWEGYGAAPIPADKIGVAFI